MKPIFLLFAASLLLARPLIAESDFSVNIQSRTRSADLIMVGSDWRKDLPRRMKVSIRSNNEVPAKALTFKAYFYDGDGNLIRKQDGPSLIWANTKKGFTAVGIPDPMPAGRSQEVFLAMPEDLKELRSTIVVFGKGEDLVATLYPSSKPIEDFDFDEKSIVFKEED